MTAPAVAAEVDCQAPRPSWCETGFVCLPSACLASLRVDRDDALADLAAARVRARRFHADLTCGPGVGWPVNDRWEAHITPLPAACVMGLAIRLGR